MIEGINLIPDEIKNEWRLRKLRALMASLAAVYLIALILVYLNQLSVIRASKAKAVLLGTEKGLIVDKSSQYSELLKRYKDMEQAETDLKKRLNVTSELSDKRVSWSTVLKSLSSDIPENTWLKSIATSDVQGTGGKRIRFLGTATSNKGVSDFVFMMENSCCYQDALLSYSQKKDYGTASAYDFEIFATLKKSDAVMYEW